MCLILLAYRAHPAADVVLAGNRDEFHSRPSAPPGLIATQPRIYAGQDLQAGGTWMGRNEHGLMAALTNRRSDDFTPTPRSRGELVRALLGHEDPHGAARWLEAQDLTLFRPFNVLFGSTRHFFYAASDEGARPQELAPGHYALSNSTLDDTSWPKVARSQVFLQQAQCLAGEDFVLALQAFLCDATPPDDDASQGPDDGSHGPSGAVFIRSTGYGTVSSTILTAGRSLGERYYFAEAADMLAVPPNWARVAADNGALYVPNASESPYRRLNFAE